jgi:hypothetical protein
METLVMKMSLFALCLLWATVSFGQTAAVIDNQPQIVQLPSHPARAMSRPMALETSLLMTGGMVSAQGQRPLWEFATKRTEMPLGDVARMYRKQHETAKKAVLVKYD